MYLWCHKCNYISGDKYVNLCSVLYIKHRNSLLSFSSPNPSFFKLVIHHTEQLLIAGSICIICFHQNFFLYILWSYYMGLLGSGRPELQSLHSEQYLLQLQVCSNSISHHTAFSTRTAHSRELCVLDGICIYMYLYDTEAKAILHK